MENNQIYIFVNIKCHPGKGEEFIKMFQWISDETHKEPGCIYYDLTQDLTNPDWFVLTELWKDKAAVDFHFQTPALKHFMENIGKFGEFTASQGKKVV